MGKSVLKDYEAAMRSVVQGLNNVDMESMDKDHKRGALHAVHWTRHRVDLQLSRVCIKFGCREPSCDPRRSKR